MRAKSCKLIVVAVDDAVVVVVVVVGVVAGRLNESAEVPDDVAVAARDVDDDVRGAEEWSFSATFERPRAKVVGGCVSKMEAEKMT